jgi:hypothetical protein
MKILDPPTNLSIIVQDFEWPGRNRFSIGKSNNREATKVGPKSITRTPPAYHRGRVPKPDG